MHEYGLVNRYMMRLISQIILSNDLEKNVLTDLMTRLIQNVRRLAAIISYTQERESVIEER